MEGEKNFENQNEGDTEMKNEKAIELLKLLKKEKNEKNSLNLAQELAPEVLQEMIGRKKSKDKYGPYFNSSKVFDRYEIALNLRHDLMMQVARILKDSDYIKEAGNDNYKLTNEATNNIADSIKKRELNFYWANEKKRSGLDDKAFKKFQEG
ncbi:hypothetical protein HOD96_00930 [Candidatus Falkowbacteria bacterium]|mgnify:CR=1 FL=1|jgi:hypothetical protein|nr:hypothetical protein [Candidatus Falkowbacteria bacterium]MBT4433177.1 hypothetical protein [Candidatus Falkowbacteria bacterium]